MHHYGIHIRTALRSGSQCCTSVLIDFVILAEPNEHCAFAQLPHWAADLSFMEGGGTVYLAFLEMQFAVMIIGVLILGRFSLRWLSAICCKSCLEISDLQNRFLIYIKNLPIHKTVVDNYMSVTYLLYVEYRWSTSRQRHIGRRPLSWFTRCTIEVEMLRMHNITREVKFFTVCPTS